MSSNGKNLTVYLLTVFIVGCAVSLSLLDSETPVESWRQNLRWTAWLAFLIYVCVFTARPLRQLRPVPAMQSMLKNRRYLGIAFAAVMTVHLALIVTLFAAIVKE